jgi:hypothetical protein
LGLNALISQDKSRKHIVSANNNYALFSLKNLSSGGIRTGIFWPSDGCYEHCVKPPVQRFGQLIYRTAANDLKSKEKKTFSSKKKTCRRSQVAQKSSRRDHLIQQKGPITTN